MATPENASGNTAVARAVAGWAGAVPDWIMELARECDDTSAHKAAVRLGVSVSLVSRAINNKHHAPLDFLQERMVGVAGPAQGVACPVLGEITPARCREERNRPFSGVNPLRVQLGRTCPECIFNPKRRTT